MRQFTKVGSCIPCAALLDRTHALALWGTIFGRANRIAIGAIPTATCDSSTDLQILVLEAWFVKDDQGARSDWFTRGVATSCPYTAALDRVTRTQTFRLSILVKTHQVTIAGTSIVRAIWFVALTPVSITKEWCADHAWICGSRDFGRQPRQRDDGNRSEK